ncbi:MAG: phosphotransferase [Bacteroidales bacterium]|nr:phosphotransferase [Bacteroidales bacterium]MBR5670440.1 phosphotransferase [Bacteroidales bacterium]
MKARTISLDDFVLSGGGFNGESFNHKTDPLLMLKLYFPGKIKQPLDEMLLARKVYDMGIPTPEPGEYVVTEDGRYGILFRRIVRKKSFSRATGDNPSHVDKYATEFAEMCLQLHSTHVDTTQFENVKDRYYRLLKENPFFTPAEKSKLEKFIADTPYEDTAIHGDLQYSNAIFAGDKRYFIDLGDFCYGNHLFDLGMVYLSTNLSDESFIKETFHMSKPLAIEFWRKFVPVYFGKDAVLHEVEEMILPYAGLKTLIIERDAGEPQPAFRAALRSILD